MTTAPSPPKEITLLIDGDTIAFTAAAAAQKVAEDDFGYFQPFAYRPEGEAIVDNLLTGLEMLFNETHYRIALSDPERNWRKDIFPDYKANRKDVARPLLLGVLKQYLRDKYGAFHYDGLEADDVLGILNTEEQEYPGERILVGKDKDFLTIPCKYHRIGDWTPSKKPIVRETTENQARLALIKQTLMGDAIDGYAGCPGIGKERAERLLADPVLLRPEPGSITRGVNKGKPTIKWVAEPTGDLWGMVVSHYAKAYKGDFEEARKQALLTARLAHILQADDYNKRTGEITLWTPDKLKGH